MGPSANYRKNVAECVRLARLSRSVEQRNILFEMARTWKELADNAARLEKIETKKEKDDAAWLARPFCWAMPETGAYEFNEVSVARLELKQVPDAGH